MSDLVGNPEDRFSRVAAHMISTYLKYLQIRVLKIPYIIGFAAELRGAQLWMKVDTAIISCVLGICPNTLNKLNTK